MIKGIIFDLDGTLLNTLYDLKEAVNYALKIKGFKEISLNQTRDYVGNGVRKLVERAINQEVSQEIKDETYDLFKKYYDVHQKDYTIPYDGVIQMVEEVSKLSMKMAIVSNKYQEGVDNLCKPLFGKYIDVMVGSQESLKLKPHPDMALFACKQLNLNPDECIFVGDSDVDALTGKNANMKVIGVSWGYRDKEVLEKLDIDYIIDKPTQLIEVIKKELNKNE